MQTEESNEIPNLDHDQPGRDGVFEHVEGTRFRVNILYQFVEEHSEPLRGRALQEHHYAPTTASAKYLKLTPNFIDRIFLKGYGNVKGIPITPGLSKKQEDAVIQDFEKHKVNDNNTAWFLPVRFVAALAKNKVDWDTFENSGDPDSDRSVGDIDDEDFVEEWAQEWFAVTDGAGYKIQNTHGFVFVPLRASNGGLRAVKCNSDLKIKSLEDAKDFKHTWMVALEELLVKSTAGASSRKFNRSVDLPMANGLKFQILKFAESRFGSNEAAEEVLTDGIKLLSKLTKPCAIKSDKLAVVFDTPDNNESAWQTLFDKETELWKDWRKKKDLQKFKAVPGLGEDKVTLPYGQLFLNCNDPDVVLRYDKRNLDGNFTWEERALVDSAEQIDQGQPQIDQTTFGELLNVAKNHSSIVYNINYSGYISASSILDAPNGRELGKFQFYPFMRPFFHRVEKYLDNHLFATMLKKGREGFKEVITTTVAVDEEIQPQSQTVLNPAFSSISSNLSGFQGGGLDKKRTVDSSCESEYKEAEPEKEKKLHTGDPIGVLSKNPSGDVDKMIVEEDNTDSH